MFSYQVKIYLSLIGGLIIHIVLGAMHITGNVTIYISSYLQHQSIPITTQDLALLIPLQVLGKTLGTILGPIFTINLNFRIALLIGNFLIVLSVALTSFLTNYILILIFYGFTFGLGVGISFIVPLIVSWSHFPQYKGRVTGFILTGFCIGTSSFNLVSTQIMNPNNEKTDFIIGEQSYFNKEVSNNLPMTLLVLSFIYLCLTLIGITILTHPVNENNIEVKNEESLSLAGPLKSKEFWLIIFMVICSIAPGFFVIGNYKTFAKDYIRDDHFLALVGSFASIFDGGSRFLWGASMDRFSFKAAYGVILFIQGSALILIYYSFQVRVLYLFCVAFVIGSKGGQIVLLTTVCSKIWGEKLGSKVCAVMFYGVTLGAVIAYLMQVVVTELLGEKWVFMIMGALTFTSFLGFKGLDENRKSVDGSLEMKLL